MRCQWLRMACTKRSVLLPVASFTAQGLMNALAERHVILYE